MSQKKVLDYGYDDEQEAERHEKTMVRDGWHVESKQHYFVKHFRRYSKEIPNGVFL